MTYFDEARQAAREQQEQDAIDAAQRRIATTADMLGAAKLRGAGPSIIETLERELAEAKREYSTLTGNKYQA